MALQDKIGRQDIIDKICGLVNSLQKDQNFCLSINGAWGSGKSFVLQMIEEQLSKKEEYVIVKYDAWENTYYSDPLISILSCVIDGIDDKLYLVERSEEKAKKAVKTAAKTLAKLSSKIKALKEIISGIKNVIKSFHNPIDTEAMGDFKSYQKLLKETKEVLNEITQKGEYDKKQTKLVVLVDEIDRCLPDEQLKILERLHHLLDIKNCAVIVALNKEAIKSTFEKKYGGNSEDYLRKFFQYNFELDVCAPILLKNKLIDLFYEINDKRQDVIIESGVNFIVDDLVDAATYIINQHKEKKIDNRDIEKFLAISKRIVFAFINIYPAFVWFALQMQLYRMFSPEHYNGLTKTPKGGNQIITNLCPYYRKELEESSFIQIYNYTLTGKQPYSYIYYENGSYNDLQFLFNVCRYRENKQWIDGLVKSIDVPSFVNDKYSILEIIKQIKQILSELDRYGD